MTLKVPPIAIAGVGSVKYLQEFGAAAVFRIKGEIEAAAPGRQLGLVVDRRAAQTQVKFAGQTQDAVADHFCFHAFARKPPQVTIVGIAGRFLGGTGRGHSIGIAGDDQLVHMLHAPARFHELDRQPIEQLRMRWLFAVAAEIEDRYRQAADRNAASQIWLTATRARERMFFVGEPQGQGLAAAGAGRSNVLRAGTAYFPSLVKSSRLIRCLQKSLRAT